MSWWVIVNPAAGRGQDLGERAAAALTAHGIAHDIRVSPSTDSVGDVVAEGAANGFTNFAAVGGDGMANLVLNGLMAHNWVTPPTLAILPAGSGSDFIRTFGIPRRLEDAASHLIDEQRYPTDVGLIEGAFGARHFLNAANVGIAARSADMATRLPDWLGATRYTIAFWMALAGFPSADVRVEVDGRSLGGDLMNVVIANGQFFGGGLNVAPRASVEDGLLDVQLFAGPRRNAPTIMARMLRGKHLSHRAVTRRKGATVRVECPGSWPVEADGEVLGTGPIAVRTLHRAILFKI
ncbi:MAG: diacylglycerol kinase family lipid kinase [Acidimicrobiia bacterium]|nr:MAG: diacylglycerol kinase family lipid kinase [Acidimicrobiia bacterium]